MTEHITDEELAEMEARVALVPVGASSEQSLAALRSARDVPRLIAELRAARAERTVLVSLLNQADGQLGLGVYRERGFSQLWVDEAQQLIVDMRRTLAGR